MELLHCSESSIYNFGYDAPHFSLVTGNVPVKREPQAQKCFAVWLMALIRFKFGKLEKGELLSEKNGFLSSVQLLIEWIY